MGENQKRILEMLATGKISVEEATRLLAALGAESKQETRPPVNRDRSSTRYLIVKVDPKPGFESTDNPKVNIRVPFALIRAGVKMGTMIPSQTADGINDKLKEKGIKFDIRNLKEEDIAPLIDALRESEINIDANNTIVCISAE
jgi:hypothetical protein